MPDGLPGTGRPAVEVEDLYVSFGDVQALCGLDLTVPRGTVLGLLGPNGAGKTTAVRVLTTLLRPTSGSARVQGLDVVRDAARVRGTIGLAGQYAAVDETLTGRENVEMVGRLYHLGRVEARSRAAQVLVELDLEDAADRQVKTYSGGMRRRLDLGASLVGRPAVLLLDEPTTGLDPRSRLGLWDLIRGLVGDGTTVLLTTQYMEEADRLADDIVVIDRGRAIAHGTSDELKRSVGGDQLTVRVDPGDADTALSALHGIPGLIGQNDTSRDGGPDGQRDGQRGDDGRLTVPVGPDGGTRLGEVVRSLEAAGVTLRGLELGRASLDDVFLSLTGHATQDADGAQESGNTEETR